MDITCELERSHQPFRGGTTVLAVRCAQRAGGGAVRPKLSVAAVLGRSTSMRGVKLGEVKSATRRLVEELSPDDFLVLIAFDSRAEVLAAGPVVKKEPFLEPIEKLEVRN